MLRTLLGSGSDEGSDEGCDIECPLCGRGCLFGKCVVCGYEIPCEGCDKPSQGVYVNVHTSETVTRSGNRSNKTYVTSKEFIRMCDECANAALEQQNKDADTP